MWNVKDNLKSSILVGLLVFLSGCFNTGMYGWRVKDMAFVQSPLIGLQGRNREIVSTVPTRTMQSLLLAHLRITRKAGVNAELVIVEEDDPNAFVGFKVNRRDAMAINIGMLELIGDDIDLYAALLGHEAAHLAKGHVEASKSRSNTLEGLGHLAGAGLGMAGVPLGGTIAGFGMDLIDSSFGREEEREADAFGIEYSMAAGYDPQGAIRLQEKMLKASGDALLPFLSGHPSGKERIENLKVLIEAQKNSHREY